jgi:hypothetical protein
MQFLYLPPGAFAIGTELSLPTGIVLVGNGCAQSTTWESATRILATYEASIRSIIHVAGANAGLKDITIDGWTNSPTLQEAVLLDAATPFLDNYFIQTNNATNAALNSTSNAIQVNLGKGVVASGTNSIPAVIINAEDWIIASLVRIDGTLEVGSGGAGLIVSEAHITSGGAPNIILSAPATFTGTYLDSSGGSGHIVHNSGAGQSTFTGCRFFQNGSANLPLVHELDNTSSVTITGGNVYANSSANAFTYLIDTPNEYTSVGPLTIDAGAIQTSGNLAKLWATGEPGYWSGIMYAGERQDSVRDVNAADFGFVGWTADPAMSATTYAALPASGTLYLIRFRCVQGGVCGHIIGAHTGGSGLTSGENFVGLYDTGQTTSGQATLLAKSADLTADWGSGNSSDAMALASEVSMVAGEDYLVGILFNGATSPGFAAVASSTTSWLVGYGQSGLALRVGTGGTGLTAMPTSISAANVVFSTAALQWILEMLDY